ncbi:MAG: NAD-dependent epimerase/dehydratase family protein [Rikenellaceae bacterium]
MSKIFITGASGFVGTALVAQLINSDDIDEIVCPLRSKKSIKKLYSSLSLLGVDAKSAKLRIVECELTDFESIKESMTGCKTVIHAAAQVDLSNSDSQRMIASNLYSTECVVTAAIDCKVKHIIHLSSIATLENDELNAHSTESSHIKNINSKSPYAISKFLSENAVLKASTEGISVTTILPAVIIGKSLGIHKGSALLTRLFSMKQPFYTLGVKGYVMLDDVVKAIIILLATPTATSTRYVLCSENLTYRELIWRLSSRKPTIKIATWVVNVVKTKLKIAEKLGIRFSISDDMVEMLITKHYYDGSLITRDKGFVYSKIANIND